jgi:D-alanyl-D-alanine dipeptidase
MDHCSPYDLHDPAGFYTAAPLLSDEAKKTRRILAEALNPAGLTNYPSEYWHWSFGDQGWAYRGGLSNAIYGQIEPPGWKPSPEDDIEATLDRAS